MSMEEECRFVVYRFKYKNKHHMPLMIFAREEKTADKIISIFNDGIEKDSQWYKPRFFFKKAFTTPTEPYILEQMQIDKAIEINAQIKKCLEEYKEEC